MDDPERMLANHEFLAQHFDMKSERILLVDMRKVGKTTKAVRQTAPEDEMQKAVALLTGLGLSKIVGNLFLSFRKPKYPTKIFSDREAAIAWLLSFADK